METVQLKGLKYDSALQNIDSGYYIVLSSVIKTKVDPEPSPPLFLRFSLKSHFILDEGLGRWR